MVDARIKGEWLTQAAHDSLSDAAYRIFHNGLMHAAEQGTNGAVDERELRFLYPRAIDPAWLEEIEAAGFWARTAAGYQFIDWSGALGQSTAQDVDKQREANRNRKRAQRAREKAVKDGDTATDAAQGNTREAPARENEPNPPTTHAGKNEGVTSSPSQRESRGASRRDVTVGVGKERKGKAFPSLSEEIPPDRGVGESTQPRASDTSPFGLALATPTPITPFCDRHPNGTDQACTGCRLAREGYELQRPSLSSSNARSLAFVARIAAQEAAKEAATSRCATHGHQLARDGTCIHCTDLRPPIPIRELRP
ncbi:hypothetical protein [Microbacterium sp.]|uniref:hypothetical protein n=1 Tax=Microbacterium sp. TaxID=51671 RepID=UPI0025E7D34C|nr:hypothetical protein [Microbacterium sp.]